MLSYHICTCNVKIKNCSCKDTSRLGAQFQIHICYMKSYTREQALLGAGFTPYHGPSSCPKNIRKLGEGTELQTYGLER